MIYTCRFSITRYLFPNFLLLVCSMNIPFIWQVWYCSQSMMSLVDWFDWCLMPTLAVFQLYCDVNKFMLSLVMFPSYNESATVHSLWRVWYCSLSIMSLLPFTLYNESGTVHSLWRVWYCSLSIMSLLLFTLYDESGTVPFL
jgi:hypothetical protein